MVARVLRFVCLRGCYGRALGLGGRQGVAPFRQRRPCPHYQPANETQFSDNNHNTRRTPPYLSRPPLTGVLRTLQYLPYPKNHLHLPIMDQIKKVSVLLPRHVPFPAVQASTGLRARSTAVHTRTSYATTNMFLSTAHGSSPH